MFERALVVRTNDTCCAWRCRIRVDVTRHAGENLELRVAPDITSTSILTPAEEEVTRLAALGYSTPAIAERRQCAPRTVKNQLNSVYLKFGISGRRELRVFLAARRSEAPEAATTRAQDGDFESPESGWSLRQRSCLGRVVECLLAGELSIVSAGTDSDGRLHGRLNPPGLAARRALSCREAEILVLSATGSSNKETAFRLGISTSAVSTYLTRARRKLGFEHPECLIGRLAALRQLASAAATS